VEAACEKVLTLTASKAFHEVLASAGATAPVPMVHHASQAVAVAAHRTFMATHQGEGIMLAVTQPNALVSDKGISTTPAESNETAPCTASVSTTTLYKWKISAERTVLDLCQQ
jgi:hypothetical protein